ncbi:retrotransposon protein, putative, ty1-copia subclass [Tanacetum coccineum]
MVRSMMSLTTLPISFWGYALESAARILNMVPTKKVNKTPYEMWHEKVPNLSYLKNSLISQEASESTVDFDEIQREDAQPSDNTSQHQPETVGSKWLFKKKTDMDGNIHTYKARLVAKGFTQTYGVDYEETFSPVTDIKAIRILIAIAAYYEYEICILDEYASFKDPSMDLSKLQRAGTRDLIRRSKRMVSLKILMSHVYIRKLAEVSLSF